MRSVALLEVADLVPDRVPAYEGERGYVATGSVDDRGVLRPELVRYDDRPTRADLVAREGDVAFARMAATSKVFAIDDVSSEYVYSTGFALVRPKVHVLDANYLKHCLRSPELQAALDANSTGATQRAITNAGIEKLRIPSIPLQRQVRIAALLDAADVLRANRRAMIDRLETLSRATFFQQFGDPLRPPPGAATSRIGAVAKVVTGNSPSRAVPANFGEDIEWIKSDNLGGTIATRAEEGLSVQGREKARIAPAGSVLVTCIAGSPMSIGKCSLVDRDVAFNQQINAILPADALDSTFLLAQLKSSPQLVRLKSSGGMKGLVNKSAFEAIEILTPSIDIQRRFAALVTAIHTQRTIAERALATDDLLFASLQARAFSGVL